MLAHPVFHNNSIYWYKWVRGWWCTNGRYSQYSTLSYLTYNVGFLITIFNNIMIKSRKIICNIILVLINNNFHRLCCAGGKAKDKGKRKEAPPSDKGGRRGISLSGTCVHRVRTVFTTCMPWILTLYMRSLPCPIWITPFPLSFPPPVWGK